jgi:glycosyltransferase involved in cell wall biosynthesis
MSPPRVSVVIPAYNAAAFIARTLETVTAQTFKDLEVIVVDDGSQDATHEIAEKFISARGLKGRSIRQANKMIAGARNTGWRAAKAELISFLDHDDLWLPRKLEVVMGEFDKHPEADLVCHNEELVKDGRVVGVTKNGPLVPHMYERLLFVGNCLSPSAVTVRKAKLEQVGGFREDACFNTVEDYDLWLRLSQVGRFHFLETVLGQYQMVERGASNKIAYHHANLEALLRDHFSRLPKNGALSLLKRQKRLAWSWRVAARALLTQGDASAAGPYAWRALKGYPLDWKNAAAVVLWAAKSLRA